MSKINRSGGVRALSAAACLAAPALAGAPQAMAQAEPPATTDQTRLEPVIVQGSRLGQTTAEIGSSVGLLTDADLDALGVDFAVDALATVSGVTVNTNGAFGGAASVRIRGAGSEQTLVLIDGVPVNDPTTPGGGYDFARLDVADIAQIEVLKGPQSTLWGTDAIGGVVSIVTKAPDRGAGGQAFAELGAFDTARGGVSAEGATETGDFRIAVVGISSDGISKADEDDGNDEADGYEATTISAKGGLNLPRKLRLEGDVRWTGSETEFDAFSFGAEGNVADGDNVNETEEISSNLSLRAPLLGGRLESLLLVGYSDISRRDFAGGAQTFAADGDRVLYRYQGTLTVDNAQTLAFGAEREDTSNGTDETSIDGLFALYEVKPATGLTLTGGLRVDDHERFGSETTGRAAAAYEVSDTLTLRASWGQGFKAPTLFQTTFACCGASGPNADLEAETSEAFDIGVDWVAADGRAEAGIAYFDQETENLITFLGGRYENIANRVSNGVEAYAAYQIARGLAVRGHYAHIDAEDGDGIPAIRVPEHAGDITVSLDPDGPLSGAIRVLYNGEERTTLGTQLDDWARVDLTGRYQVSETVEVYGRLENALNANYQQVLGYGTPGVSGSLGIRVRYR